MIPSISLAAAIDYPSTRKAEVTEELHGTQVPDPYRWLEDDNAAETKSWVAAQNGVTESFLATIPQRGEIRKRLADLWNFERTGAPQEFGGKWFFTHNTGLQNQSVLKVADSLDGEGKLLLDPNSLSDDGTVSLANFTPSEDGKLLGYSISRGGSDWNEILVRDVATGKDTGDHLKWVKFSGISWAKDGSGFYYSRYEAPLEGAALTQKNEFQNLCFHKIGTPQSEDPVIYERKDQPRWGLGGGLTEDGKFLVIHVSEGTDPKNRFFYRPVDGEKVIELLADADASYDFIGNKDGLFYFRTDLEAPRHRIIAIDVAKPERSAWKEIIPQSKDLLQEASMVGGKLVVEYLKDAKSAVAVYDSDGKKVRDVDLPGIGSASGFGGREKDKQTFYSFTGFTDPGAIYRYDLESGTSTLWKRPKVGFDGSAYETKQVFATSKDGTKVPVFLVHKKGIALDGSHRTLLTGYGGFNISITPGFSIGRAVWLERGGILAVANLRGGGEYGSDWHLAGTRLQKQNVFDDFIAAAEWLVNEKYTSSKKLAIQGGSNGGLLVGACMTQRPDLFGAALPAVGVMDMLRFHKFTIGWAWEKDYGSAENAEEFKALLRYSPYHVLKNGTRYPATMVTTADHDDRVVPAHSFKFAARLQECQAKDGPPVLIRIDTSAGHGAGTALSKMIDKTADEWAFLESVL
ncbi:prolyl oligopeptidase family serine peptidase [Luteolibacter arcticus]|uniref:prolyl oligopeptidase n=1 Tax=Luteolibacter arcticus TaxID=1581411 RepID=A0ABT3GFY8_9BACT|nr:prolyl oligopeptidase family serine peptidase [Luteolibacter arcticus]MCW1922220.1 prolyl oligopeptidase family serine peptidase [Luteolibacter arcticus]